MKLEICVDTIDAATIAAVAGASRIELCSALSDGGLTPSYGVMMQASKLSISCHAMIRPRGQGFIYSDVELLAMQHDISAAKNAGMDGVVIGVLNEDLTLNVTAMQKLIETAQPLEVTLHRAIDMTPDPIHALEQAIDLGFQRILTSGQCETAFEGIDTIAKLVAAADGRITIMPGSGINTENVVEIVRHTSVKDIHSSCATVSNPSDYFGFDDQPTIKMTDRETVEKMLRLLEHLD